MVKTVDAVVLQRLESTISLLVSFRGTLIDLQHCLTVMSLLSACRMLLSRHRWMADCSLFSARRQIQLLLLLLLLLVLLLQMRRR